MKSEVIENNKVNREFPKMMRYKKTGLVVLFNTSTTGVVVANTNSTRTLGEYDSQWSLETFPHLWEDFDGQVVLENTDI